MIQKTYRDGDDVDFIVVGSGSSGGVLAKELSAAGFHVVVLEQGPWQQTPQFGHDELSTVQQGGMLNTAVDPVQTFRRSETETAKAGAGLGLLYRRGVGGSSVHFTANFWRLRPIDFRERSVWGSIEGSGFSDWPITYEELEPYYTKVDWEIGVSGAPGPFDAPRSRPYPLPPLPVKSSGVLLERAAGAMGLHAQAAPMAILSRPYDGRSGCMACGRCMGYGCEYGAKSSTLVSMIPKAVATGRCEIRVNCTVFRVETNTRGRATGVMYWDADGKERRQSARAVVLAANGAETARLLLLSTSPRFPHGLANSSGKVGRYIMFNGYGGATGLFTHPLNEYKGHVVSRIIHDYYDADPKRGFYGGGGIDARFSSGPIAFALDGLPSDVPSWGKGYTSALHDYYTRTVQFTGHTTSLAVESNSVSLDPDHRDRWGRPSLRLTYKDHPDDMKTKQWFQDRTRELMEAAGAEKVWTQPVRESTGSVHLLGTARMGNDPQESVVDKHHRAHDVPNLFICDGSSLVTSTRGQPTMTIQALAFRAADHIGRFAREHALCLLALAGLALPNRQTGAQSPRAEFVAASASAPLSQFVRVGDAIYLSGMLGSDAGGIVAGGITPETRQALTNVRSALEKSGATMDDVVKCTVFLADMQEWAAMNEVYATFFTKNKPARSAVGVNGLARNARVEIECIAVRGAGRS